MPDIEFGEWLPDREIIMAPGMRVALNLAPTALGYRWFPASRNMNKGALDSDCIGAMRGFTSGGQLFNVAGTKNNLWLDTGLGFDEVSSETDVYNLGGQQNWGFTQFGENLFGFNKDVPQFYSFDAGTPSTEFQDIDAFPGAVVGASAAAVGMVFREFLVLGNIVGRTPNTIAIGKQEGGIHWSAQGAPYDWPQVGTAEAINVQSDFQVFEGAGGKIQAMVPAGEYALIFREREVWRMDYVGPPLIFAFRKLDANRGCIGQNAAVAVGPLVYFPSFDGYKVCDGASVQSIGHEKIDRTWRNILDYEKTARISVVHAPQIPAVLWTIPGSTTASVAAILGYQYELGRWFALNQNVEWLQTVVPSDNALDEIVDLPTYGLYDMDDLVLPNLGNVEMDTLGPSVAETFSVWLSDHTLYAHDSSVALTVSSSPD